METTTPFVLVHDLWHSQAHWRAVADRLTASGHATHRLTLPGHGIDAHLDTTVEDEITHVIDALTMLDDPANLVAHGWSGAVASAAAARVPEQVRQVVYVAAILPEDGPRSLWDELPAHLRDVVEDCIDAEGRVTPPLVEVWQEHWVGWAPQRQVQWWHATLTPVPVCSVTTRIDLTDWYTTACAQRIPTTYIHLRDDIAYGAAHRWREYAACLSEPDEVTIPGGHEVMLTAPGLLAAALQAAVGGFEPATGPVRVIDVAS